VLGVADGQPHLAEGFEYLGLTGAVTGFPAEGQGLVELIHGVLVAPQVRVELTEAAQGMGLVGLSPLSWNAVLACRRRPHACWYRPSRSSRKPR
jgi:hypothetical protein